MRGDGGGGQDGDEGEESDDEPQPLSEEALQALSADELYNIWVRDTHDTLQAATNPMVQEKLQKAMLPIFGGIVKTQYIRGATLSSFNGLTPMRTAWMKGLLGSKLYGTEWDPRVSYSYRTAVSNN